MTNRGAYDRLITVQQGTPSEDDYGGETLTWSDLEQAWARVLFGLSEEKREAAQEAGRQSATFLIIPTEALLGVRLKDRILFDDSAWDITEVAPLDRNELRLTAVRVPA